MLINEEVGTAIAEESAKYDVLESQVTDHYDRCEAIDCSRPSVATATQNPPQIQQKLHILQLLEYNGETPSDQSWERFQAVVGRRTDLDEVSKLNYLQGQLKCQTAELASGFQITSSSYKPVVDSLKENYGGAERAVAKSVHKVLNLPNPAHNLR